jgi:hypothetical protein
MCRRAQERDGLSSASELATSLRLKRQALREKDDDLDRLMRMSGRELTALLPSQTPGKPYHCHPQTIVYDLPMIAVHHAWDQAR